MPADYLSRNKVEAIDISYEDLAEMQDKDKFCASLKHLLNKKTSRNWVCKKSAWNDRNVSKFFCGKQYPVEKDNGAWRPAHSGSHTEITYRQKEEKVKYMETFYMAMKANSKQKNN